MKKIIAILQGKAKGKLMEAKEKRIMSQIDLAKANKEEALESYKDKYENLFLEFGNDDLSSEDSKKIIEQLLETKFAIKDAEEVISTLNEVKADLEKDIEVEE